MLFSADTLERFFQESTLLKMQQKMMMLESYTLFTQI